VLGLRLNVWTSIVLFILATIYFVVVGRRHPGRETEVYTEQRLAADRALAAEESEPATVSATTGAESEAEPSTTDPEPGPGPEEPEPTSETEPKAKRAARTEPTAEPAPAAEPSGDPAD
jgi:hypothetical protein